MKTTAKKPKETKPKAQEINIFTFINQILYKTNKVEYDPKIAGGYMLVMWFSHGRQFLPIVDKILPLVFTLTDRQIYDYLYSSIPKGKAFLKWTKKEKSVDTKIAELCKKYNISKMEATSLLGGN